jgi:ABC-type polysaccharide/polyol phosphate export permease
VNLQRVSAVGRIWGHRHLLRELVARDLRVKYQRSVLGILWSALRPLLMLSIYVFVFSRVMGINIEGYGLFVLTGLIPWTFLATSLSLGASSLYENGPLIQRAAFPLELLPLSIVLGNLIHLGITLLVFVPVLLLLGWAPAPALLALPAVCALQLLLVAGVTLLVATGAVFFRDLVHLLEIVTTIWFYTSPVVYPMAMVPEPYRTFLGWNPMGLILELYRELFVAGRLPAPASVVAAAAAGLAVYAAGALVFRRAAPLIPKVV